MVKHSTSITAVIASVFAGFTGSVSAADVPAPKFIQDPPELSTPVQTQPQNLKRATIFESGLSVLIPYLDPLVDRDSLRRAIVAEYHFAILAGRLVVELAEGDQCEVIDADHLPATGEPTVDALIDLSRWAIAHPEPAIKTQLPTPNEPQRLSEELVSESVQKAIGEALDRRERVAIRLPLHVHPRDGDPQPTFVMGLS